jgi:predicted esterase
MDLPTVVIEPSEPHSHTVVFLHGCGDSAKNFARTVGYSWDSHMRPLYGAFPSFRWVFPQAPIRRSANGHGIMYKWFDTWSTTDFSEREELQVPGLQEIVPAIRLLLAAEAERLEGRWDKVILAGISMGGATSAHAIFNLAIPPPAPGLTVIADHKPGRLGALMTFSSLCPYVGRSLEELRTILDLPDVPDNADVLRNTPMLLEHCIDDNLVPISTGHALRDTMMRFGAQVTWKEYPDGGHWFNSPTGIDDAVIFLKKHLFGEALEATSSETTPAR